MKNNNLGYELNLDKVARILAQWNMTHENKVAWAWSDEAHDITCHSPVPQELQDLINHATL